MARLRPLVIIAVVAMLVGLLPASVGAARFYQVPPVEETVDDGDQVADPPTEDQQSDPDQSQGDNQQVSQEQEQSDPPVQDPPANDTSDQEIIVSNDSPADPPTEDQQSDPDQSQGDNQQVSQEQEQSDPPVQDPPANDTSDQDQQSEPMQIQAAEAESSADEPQGVSIDITSLDCFGNIQYTLSGTTGEQLNLLLLDRSNGEILASDSVSFVAGSHSYTFTLNPGKSLRDSMAATAFIGEYGGGGPGDGIPVSDCGDSTPSPTPDDETPTPSPTPDDETPTPSPTPDDGTPSPTPDSEMKTINAHALGDADCEVGHENEWHFIINQLRSAEDAPAFITVTFDGATQVQIPLEKVSGDSTAHYTLTGQFLDSEVTAASAVIYAEWEEGNGQFVLSHAPCEDDGTPSPTPDDGTPSPTPDDGTPSPTPDDSTPSPTPDDGTPSPTPDDETPTPSPTPDDGTPSPTPDDGTPSPTPDDSTPSPTPDDGTPSPTPDDGTPTEEPTTEPTEEPEEKPTTPVIPDDDDKSPPSTDVEVNTMPDTGVGTALALIPTNHHPINPMLLIAAAVVLAFVAGVNLKRDLLGMVVSKVRK